MLTVQGLLKEFDLSAAAGEGAAGRPIRWVHISELEDPTPWLTGGELLLTTGMELKSPAAQRRFVRLLAEHGLAGLGLGTGFSHKRIPKALVTEAEKLDFPLFEVPYEMPFIAITEKAFARLVNEHYDVLARGISLHESLERLVLEERGLSEILGAVAGAIGGEVVVLDGRGQLIARGSKGRRRSDKAALEAISAAVAEHTKEGHMAPFIPEGEALADRAMAVPVPARGRGMARAWLAVIGAAAPLADLERLIARQAAVVVALALMRDRIVRETERRLAGDVLAEALGGRLDTDELHGRLRPFGIGERAAMLVFELADPAAAEPALEAALADAGCPALVATTGTTGRELLCAVIDASESDPVEVATRARRALDHDHAGVRAAASRAAPAGSLRRSFHEARCALEATSLADGDAPEVASHRDLGAFTLLLALQDDEALRAYSDGLLAPIEGTDGEYGGELLRSLEAYIEQNGQWEKAARTLYCHRHTLRYRIRRVEELTGRDLTRAHDRIELWLALRARELVR
jgi:purine catabolism regulator